ncbi:plasmid mobilization relaxosome protein MobC [Streptomyces erythrochromogenes]|uniref:plasmid mobilization relaxosome protein MobC n=1 Tax=Streptomyces erythrochromogenes TaxID=285574 RepID=UPI002257A31C|nr:plasmid mobilization relaxosome protein MobC [Streptomyces erythrochromogenes]MCX5585539.1 plasmid mobilization relaxosome protein MobC [Streptomyces erythrochromogenes]
MHDHQNTPLIDPQEITTPAPSGARYGVGPSKGRSNAASAPGVAEEEPRREGAPGQKAADTADAGLPVVVRATDEAALYRIARRRARQKVQRKMRVDVRYSADEHTEILAEARRLNLAGAHYVGAVVTAHLNGDLALPGQRTSHDDLIDELAALRAEVAAIGKNVNQIAFKLNSGGHPQPGDTALLAEARRVLVVARDAATSIDVAADKTATSKAAA